MKIANNEMMSSLVKLANLAREELSATGSEQQARDVVTKIIGHDHFVMLNLLELSEIKYQAEKDDQPSVGDVNSHTDRWLDDSGREIGTISGEGWKIAQFGEDIISYYRETAETALGRIEVAGLWNSSAIWQKQWQSLPATGVSGDVTGMFGVRQLFQETPRKRYRTFILLLPLERTDESLQAAIRNGYIND